MSNSCFYSFCRFVKAGCAVWLQAHPDSRAGGDALREQMGSLQAAPREMVPGCQLPPRSREPGPLGMLVERDKLTLQAAFLLSDLKKKKHLGIIFTQWQQPQNTELEVRWHGRGPQLPVSELCALRPTVSPLKVCFSIYIMGRGFLCSVLIRTKQSNDTAHSLEYSCSVQSQSRVRLFPMPWDCSTPGLPVSHRLVEFAQVHIHWMGDAYLPKKTNRI